MYAQYLQKNWFDFHPEHREDLAASGITYKSAVSHKIHTVPPRHIDSLIKDSRIHHMLAFPYFDIDGTTLRLTRYKVWPKIDGRKYFQGRGSISFVYFTKYFLNVCSQFLHISQGTPLYITEGEKKALALSQRGKPACALSGVWNMSDQGLEALEALNVKCLNYIPDSDVFKREDLKQSVIRLESKLSKINCKLEVVKWVKKE